MENLGSDAMTLNGYYGTQQNVPGLIQLNLMEPPHEGYYVNQQSMQGLGQLSSIAPSHDGFYAAQQTMPGLVQDLSRMYRLFSKIPKGLEPVANIFKQQCATIDSRVPPEYSREDTPSPGQVPNLSPGVHDISLHPNKGHSFVASTDPGTQSSYSRPLIRPQGFG